MIGKAFSHVAVLVLIAVGSAGVAIASPVAAEEPAPEKSTAKFEVDFLMDMIDHHAMAVEMAEICLDNAAHLELLETCDAIKTSQSQQIDQMQSWLQEWYDMSHESMMNPGQMRQMERLASLSGAVFEIEFMQSMIKHHHQAIREGEMCLRRGYHGELLDLCDNITAAQSAEIAKMEQWLCEWYDRCQGRAA